jgi:GNAT superfamily N-acetyltransferase
VETRQGYGSELHAGGAEVKFEVSNLNEVSNFKNIVADRIWNAWWRPHGRLLQVVTDFFDDLPEERGIPFCLVAHDDGRYLGSVLAIASDLDERPELSPWVGALWVEPEFRRHGVATGLVKAALTEVFSVGPEVAFLCATAEKRVMYQNQGWKLIEEKVGDGELDVFEFGKPQTLII